MARAFVFPGQGSQAVGMGRELADAFAPARHVFEEVDVFFERFENLFPSLELNRFAVNLLTSEP